MSVPNPSPVRSRDDLRELLFRAIVEQTFVRGTYRLKLKRAGHPFFVTRAGKQDSDGNVTIHLDGQDTGMLEPVAIDSNDNNIAHLMEWRIMIRILVRVRDLDSADATCYRVGDFVS